MKVVIAPDSFKESMTAIEACQAINKAFQSYSSIETIQCPLADGGEGTLETLVHALNGQMKTYRVHGPLMNWIYAPIGYVEDKAIIECAKVCGLELLEEHQKNPYYTTTYGLGELILHALNQQVKEIMICLGSSATNDGGIGMLQALGVDLLSVDNEAVTPAMKGLKDIHHISIQHLDLRLKDIHIVGLCDVDNPLCGPTGATYIYGPQKGVQLSQRDRIDQQMYQYGKMSDQLFLHDYMEEAGTGAAGGLGYALKAYLKAELIPGFDMVSEALHLRKHIQESDLVIVGEGKMDQQTQFGKTPYGVLKIAQQYHKDVFAFAGQVKDEAILKSLGFKKIYQITPPHIELSVALKKGKDYLQQCVEQYLEEML